MKKLVIILSISLIILSCEKDREISQSNEKPKEWKITLFQPDVEYQRISNGANNIYCYGIKMNSNNSGLIYSLIKSDDLGQSWENVNYTPNDIPKLGGWIEMGFYNDTIGFISGSRTLFRTFNGGYNWDTISLGYDFNGLLVHENKLFGYYSQFGYSENFGKNWIKINEPKYVFSLCFINKDQGFASSYDGLYETMDGGVTWNLKSNPNKVFFKMSFADNKNGIATSRFQVSPHAAPEILLNLTNDGGLTWQTSIMDSISKAKLGSVLSILYKSTDEIYVGGSSAIFLSKDKGISWKPDYIDSLYNGGIFIGDIKFIKDKLFAVGWGGLILTK